MTAAEIQRWMAAAGPLVAADVRTAATAARQTWRALALPSDLLEATELSDPSLDAACLVAMELAVIAHGGLRWIEWHRERGITDRRACG